MVVIGDTVKFAPFKGMKGILFECNTEDVTGTVVMINYKHKWFLVEFGESKLRTAFNFADIGKDVTICGGI
jgi:hypothetical protein